jgi:hypothetical protein
MTAPNVENVAAPLVSLDDAHKAFQRWLGDDYDQDALNAVLAAAAVGEMDGDPLWLLVISGPGNAKTETVQSLVGAGALISSTIASEGALLSATAQKEVAKGATGGLLRELGDRGSLVIKDVTSILTMDRTARGQVLSALREIYDGSWFRRVGVDGGRVLTWAGRLVVVGAVTTAWDTAHAVVSAMGDRFVLVRMDSKGKATRRGAGRQAMANVGSEVEMRAELASAVGGVIAGMSTAVEAVGADAEARLLAAADLVTLARTGVEFDYQGNVIDAHAPEMPTRFAKQLVQVVRGAVAIGIGRDEALRLAIRCARDSMPPLRLAIVDDVAAYPRSTPSDVRRRLNRPWRTIDRQMQALHMLEVLDVEEEEYGDSGKTRWHYSLAEGVDPDALSSPEMLVEADMGIRREGESARRGTNKSGEESPSPNSNGQVPETVTSVTTADESSPKISLDEEFEDFLRATSNEGRGAGQSGT